MPHWLLQCPYCNTEFILSEVGKKDRVADYRLICKIENDRLVVLVLRVGPRKEIYRQCFRVSTSLLKTATQVHFLNG